jgi:aminopeptidase N
MQTVSRLTEQFTPEKYQIALDLDRTARVFSGIVSISGTSTEGTEIISVHAKDLIIASVTFDGKTAEWRAGDNDELIITHQDMLPGTHILVIAYSGTITDAMHGLYPCYYEHDGVKKELLATQFESHHAREVFPCIDEPAAKATFDVTLTTEQDVTVLGNMPAVEQKVENGRLVTIFDTTPRMSTYLLAWVVGELHCKTATTKSGVEVNIWATPVQPTEGLDFALGIATRTIDFFDEYFGTPYPLPKSDHVALPDFSSGAMENWGLITYREVALLADPKTTSVSSKRYIATVIAHELSHQWFGNLVTMKWWNNLWLNESFATLMEYIAVDSLHPEWDIWLDFATSESIMALRRDSIEGVQAVQVDVHHPDEISTLFDSAIVYAKGARLLRMLQQYIGHEAFQTGLKSYFTKYKYGNTDGNDLWKELGTASGEDIARFMNTWISQSGYPVLRVSKDKGHLILSQDQFFVGPHAASEKIWPIPLNASDSTLPKMLESKQMDIPYATTQPVRFNVGDTAHFVTQYDNPLLTQLLDMVKAGNLTTLDRLQLLHEQSLLARGGIVSSSELIPMLNVYKGETTEAVWDIMSLAIGELKKFVLDDASEGKLRKLATDLARKQYERLGWTTRTEEPETDTKMRATILGMMIYGEDEDAIKQAISLYKTTPLEKLDAELRALIIGTMVRHGDDQTIINTLIDYYKTTSSGDLQQDISSGLTSTRSLEGINELLELTKDEKVIRPQDSIRWFAWLIRNRDGRTLTWKWLRENWPWVEKTFAGDKSYDYFPRYAASALVTRQELDEYRAFFTPMLTNPSLERVITIGMSEIEGRIELIERDSAAVRESLNKL